MKRLLILLFVSFMSCKAYQGIHKITEQVYVGMHVSEFLQIADKRYQKDAMDSEVFVYRVNRYDWYTGAIIDSMFYYFDAETEKLIKVDAGTRWN